MHSILLSVRYFEDLEADGKCGSYLLLNWKVFREKRLHGPVADDLDHVMTVLSVLGIQRRGQ